MAGTYDHVQHGFIHYVSYGAAAVLCSAAIYLSAEPWLCIVLLAVALVLLLVGLSMSWLRVLDDGDRLGVRFGPLPVFRASIPYDAVGSVEVARTNVLHGWGIHGIPFRWLTYNVSGFRCVTIRLREPRGLFRVRAVNIGTDDPENLALFLSGKAKEYSPSSY